MKLGTAKMKLGFVGSGQIESCYEKYFFATVVSSRLGNDFVLRKRKHAFWFSFSSRQGLASRKDPHWTIDTVWMTQQTMSKALSRQGSRAIDHINLVTNMTRKKNQDRRPLSTFDCIHRRLYWNRLFPILCTLFETIDAVFRPLEEADIAQHREKPVSLKS
jgi:hypothetical protein